ncbi:hypothetical protein BDF14DRAFT_1886891 [Spinellus fusiger]|nr:hypothetical protein BDF14DRAFT_1886891 [Spinellus fusiger]
MSALALKRRTPSLGALPTIASISVVDTPLPTHSTKPVTHTSSLYHTCCSVLNRLTTIEGMMDYLEIDTVLSSSSSSSEPPTPTQSNGDPLSKLWTMARLGSPMCTLFNALSPETPLHIDTDPMHSSINTCKKSIYHFLVACRKQLEFSEEDVFTITDLYQDDTNGFVKVVNTINKLLQLLEEKGVISATSSHRNSDPNAPKDTRDKVVLELIETERKYVQDMEILQNYMRELQAQKIVSPDSVHYLFGNLNALVDFQRRFLVQLEEIVEKVPEEQRVGSLFMQMEDAFAVYEPYCANYYSAQDLVVQEAPKLLKLADILNPTYELPSMLIKPVQRICKYPLLLNQLLKSTCKDWSCYSDTEEGLEAIRRVTEKVNETQRRHENLQVVEDLKRRVSGTEDLAIEAYGHLLLQEKLQVGFNDNTRELHCFLFEKALLMCKESKESRNRLTKGNTLSIKKKQRSSLQSKGTIHSSRILSVQNRSSPGNWCLIVEYKDREVEQFSLKVRNEEQLKQWEAALLKVKMAHKTSVPSTHLMPMPSPSTPVGGTMNGRAFRYEEEEEEDEEDEEEEEEDEEEYQQRIRNSSMAHAYNSHPRTRGAYDGTNNAVQPMPSSSSTSSNGSNSIHPMATPSSSHLLQANSPVLANASTSALRTRSASSISFDYSLPVSPPPSTPSSPTSIRVSSNSHNTNTVWQRRVGEESSPLAEIATKFMTGETYNYEDYQQQHYHQQLSSQQQQQQHYHQSHPQLPPIGRSQSHSATAATLPAGLGIVPQAPILQTRLRSQSSPNIQKVAPNFQEDLTPMPSTSRAFYTQQQQAQQQQAQQQQAQQQQAQQQQAQQQAQRQQQPLHTVRSTSSTPRLSGSQSSLKYQSDRTTIVVPSSPGSIKVKLSYNDGIYVIVVAHEASFIELMEKVEKKIRLVANLKPNELLRLKYQDEDGDHITINSDDDVQMAFENCGAHNTVSLFVSL